jgi:hypothetical protein
MEKYLNSEPLFKYAEQLRVNGLDIIVSEDKDATWFHFGTQRESSYCIGYVQYDKYRGFEFSTEHVPKKGVGSGFLMFKSIDNPTFKMAEDTLFTRPNWSFQYHVKHWDSLEAFLKSENRFPTKKYVVKEI